MKQAAVNRLRLILFRPPAIEFLAYNLLFDSTFIRGLHFNAPNANHNRRLITSYRQFVVDLRQNVVFALKDDVTSYGLRVAR
jgi:hypothetical protein